MSNCKWKIFSNFVAFSEYPNFNWVICIKEIAGKFESESCSWRRKTLNCKICNKDFADWDQEYLGSTTWTTLPCNSNVKIFNLILISRYIGEVNGKEKQFECE